MKSLHLNRYALAIAAGALLAGCGGAQPPAPVVSGARDAAFTAAHYVRHVTHADRSESWLQPDKAKGALLYVGDWSTNDVFVYDFPSGKQVGTLTGGSEPYGMCVDSKGDIYVAEFGAGELVEYGYGKAKPIQTYAAGGEPIGCSVSAKGDVSSTSFSPGEVTVFAKGNPKAGTTYSDSSCEYIWTMGYDHKGDLIGVGEYSSIDVCGLLSGSKSETVLTTKGIVIDFPAGTAWDGKYIALGDQEAGGTYQSGVWPAKLSGTTLSPAGKEIVFTDNCYSDYVDMVNPFFLGKGFVPVTAASTQRAKYVISPNLWCADAGEGQVDVWHYPSGKLYKQIKFSGSTPYGAGMSTGT